MNMPHYPYQGDTKFLKQFEHVAPPRNLYNAFVASQDQRIGQLLHKLDSLGLVRTPSLCFQSDNGHSTNERAGSLWWRQQWTLSRSQVQLFEGGIRLPAIISWPLNLPAGQSRAKRLTHAMRATNAG